MSAFPEPVNIYSIKKKEEIKVTFFPATNRKWAIVLKLKPIVSYAAMTHNYMRFFKDTNGVLVEAPENFG